MDTHSLAADNDQEYIVLYRVIFLIRHLYLLRAYNGLISIFIDTFPLSALYSMSIIEPLHIWVLTCLSVSLAVYRKSLPSRLNMACGLSRMMNTISAGILPGAWSPSFWNVTLVPDFQPGLIDICRTLSSFLELPSGWTTRREIFIFLTQPW